MITIRILDWDPVRTDWNAFYIGVLERRLRESLNLGRLGAKRLAKQVCNGECREIPLNDARDRYDAHSFRQFLEDHGAIVSVDED
jgi:hypothetical protein